MGDHDPYSSSKGCAELLIASYRDSYFSVADYNKHKTAIASVRAGNVIGGGDWAEDRLIPDIIRAVQSNKLVHIRNPNSIHP
jgi:CDP-glucose 4,6-dehydratase